MSSDRLKKRGRDSGPGIRDSVLDLFVIIHETEISGFRLPVSLQEVLRLFSVYPSSRPFLKNQVHYVGILRDLLLPFSSLITEVSVLFSAAKPPVA